jgi:hypothetical protein
MELSILNIPELDWEDEPLGLKMHFIFHIVTSLVEVECQVNRYLPDDVPHLHMRALDLARACVDVWAFAKGVFPTVYLETFFPPKGDPQILVPQNPVVAGLCSSYKFDNNTSAENTNLDKVIRLLISDPALFMPLNELSMANTLPHLAPANCGRVLDGLRKLVVPGFDPKKAWPIFQASLNADEKYLEFISDLSANPRHGDRSHIPAAPVMEAMKRTWVIMDRFIEYRKKGNQPLPLANFPLLKG